MKIMIVDDHRLFLEGMRHLVMQVAPDAIVTTCESVQIALAVLDQGDSFNLILIDLSMPGLDGLAFLQSVRSRRIVTPVVVVSASESMDDVHRILEQGALGFIPKSFSPNDMLVGLETVLAGNIYLPNDLWENYDPVWQDQKETEGIDSPRLKKRQLRVLRLMSEGHTNKQIANVLNVSEATVKYHVGVLFRELGTRRRTACIQAARKRNLLPDSS